MKREFRNLQKHQFLSPHLVKTIHRVLFNNIYVLILKFNLNFVSKNVLKG